MRIRRKKIGLALGSGAARGFAPIGVIKVLDANRIPISMVAGTSMGALIGALYAAGLSGDELEEIACNVDFKTIAKLFVPTPSFSGLISGNRIAELLESLVGDVNIKSLRVPLAVIAVDIESAEEVVIAEGSLVEAVRASISIPGIFTAANYQDRFLVDGGLLNPVPVNVVRDMGANFVIAVNVPYPIKPKPVSIKIKSAHKDKRPVQIANSESFNRNLSKFVNKKANLKQLRYRLNELIKGVLEDKKFTKPNIFKAIMVTIRIMENQIKQLQLSQHSPDILIEPRIGVTSSFDFRKAREIIKVGEQEARKALRKIL